VKVRKYQASEEKTILTALIVHDRVCGTVAREFGENDEPFKNRWSNVVARWCFQYFNRHRKAPGKLIQELFVQYAQQEEDQEAVALVEKFLGSLSDDYRQIAKEINERWVLDRAAAYFERVRLEKMAEQVSLAVERHDLELARKAYDTAKPVSFSEEGWLNPFSKSTVTTTLENLEKAKPVIQFKGDLGRFLSPYFERDGFICLSAPEKRGKSYWLMEMVWQALQQRRRVLYYVLGDMSAEQVYRRLYCRITSRPRKPLKDGLEYPVRVKPGPKDEAGRPTLEVVTEHRDVPAIDQVSILKAVKKLRLQTAMRQDPLRLKCAGAGVLSASDIERDIIRLREDEEWSPDLVVVDYADLVATERAAARLDFRHQIDATWKIFRRISTDHHLLFLTATQASAKSYRQWLIRKDDFSEDKRKNAHVTGMLGLNQTPEEKKKGIYRLNWPFLRDGVFAETQVCWTVGNLAIANPCIKSLLV
jgi:hypothetical protein